MQIKKILHKLIPKGDNSLLYLCRNYLYDFNRYISYSSFKEVDSKAKYRAILLKKYHSIEKRLSFRNTRVGFAPERIHALLKTIEEYNNLYGADEVVDQALNSLLAYYKYNLENRLEDKELFEKIMVLKRLVPEVDRDFRGGYLKKNKTRNKPFSHRRL